MKKSSFIFFLFFSLALSASHNRAGEILYQRIPPYTSVVSGSVVAVYNYLITVILYTDDGTTSSPNTTIADRCVLDTLDFGDGQYQPVSRMNGPDPLCAGCYPCGCPHCGELIVPELGFRVKKNIYQATHTYPGAGNYHIRVRDPNRNADIINIPHSDLVPFYVESLLMINPLTGSNNSPVLLNPPIDRACVDKCFTHNPGAYDSEGDSLSYQIIKCMEGPNDTIPGYEYPNFGTNDEFDINATTGYLKWCSPRHRGQYNAAFIIREWRKNTDGYYTMIGYVIRDMQINVDVCLNNDPPLVITPPDTCVEAGTLITKKIKVSDPNTGNLVTLLGTDGGFAALTPTATLSNTSGIMTTANGNSFLASFSWQTSCNHVRSQAYECVFKVQDNGSPVELADFGSYNIRVVPPSVKSVTAVPAGSNVDVSWQLSTCSPSSNPLVGYKVYRKNDCIPFVFTPCQTGVPPSSGFTFIGRTNASANLFTDNNNGNGLTVGQNYSYLVVAIYNDSSETFASSQVCTRLRRNIPLLLNVDVRTTSATNGAIYIHWENPLTTAGNFDTIAFPGPYTLTLNYREPGASTYISVFTSATSRFLNLANSYLHTGINTQDTGKDYSIDFLSGTTTIGSSQPASSVFLNATPGDRKVHLQWRTSTTPWTNSQYVIWRKKPSEQNFIRIDSVPGTNYTDSSKIANLIANHNTYCYKVLAKGAYSDPSVYSPLLNFSQEACAVPKDMTPPCTPTLDIQADCAAGTATVTWNDVRTLPCGDDVLNYILYYKPTLNDEYRQVANGLLTFYKYDGSANDSLISGCYAIQAVDSSNNISRMSPDFCLDNCPIFELPNVFTPNKDGINEFFQAIRVRQIKKIDMSVFDRWGNLVYKTSDPYFHWNGESIANGLLVSDGTLFYICDVFENRLKGLTKRNLKGFVQLMR